MTSQMTTLAPIDEPTVDNTPADCPLCEPASLSWASGLAA